MFWLLRGRKSWCLEESNPTPNPAAAASTVSLNGPPSPVSTVGTPATAAAAAATGGALAGMAAAAASKRNSPPPPVDNVYRVQLDFKPSMEDELEIRAGQLVRMLHGYDDGWVCSPISFPTTAI